MSNFLKVNKGIKDTQLSTVPSLTGPKPVIFFGIYYYKNTYEKHKYLQVVFNF